LIFLRTFFEIFEKIQILGHFVKDFDIDFEKSIKKMKEKIKKIEEKKNIDEVYKGSLVKRHQNLLQALNQLS